MMTQSLEFSQSPEQSAEKILHKMGYAIKIQMESLPGAIGPLGCYVNGISYDVNRDKDVQVVQIQMGDFESFSEQKKIEIADLNRTSNPLREIEIISKFAQNDVYMKLSNLVVDTVRLPLDMELSYLDISNCRINNLYLMSCPPLRNSKAKGMAGYHDLKIKGLSGTNPSAQTRIFCLEEQNPPEKLLAHVNKIRGKRPPKFGPANNFVFPENDGWFNREMHEKPLNAELVKEYTANGPKPA